MQLVMNNGRCFSVLSDTEKNDKAKEGKEIKPNKSKGDANMIKMSQQEKDIQIKSLRIQLENIKKDIIKLTDEEEIIKKLITKIAQEE